MLIINWSGMNQIYWLPQIKYGFDKALWFVEFKFLIVQTSLYSMEMDVR
jgi:hypothetical protein